MYIDCITRIYLFSTRNPFALLQAVLTLLKPDNGQSTPAQGTLTPAQESKSNMELLDYSAAHNVPPPECRSLSDTATQYCFDLILFVSVATQTDDVRTTVPSHNSSNGNSLVTTQASFDVSAEEWKISHDHNYSIYVPIVYPTYGVDEHSLTPYKEIEVGPLVENSIDNDFKDKEVYDDDIDDNYKDPNWIFFQFCKKSCSLMDMSPLKKNQKGNYNLLTQIKISCF